MEIQLDENSREKIHVYNFESFCVEENCDKKPIFYYNLKIDKLKYFLTVCDIHSQEIEKTITKLKLKQS